MTDQNQTEQAEQPQTIRCCADIRRGICPFCQRDKFKPFTDERGVVRMCLTGFEKGDIIAD
jgi:hypothetical protein